MTPQSVSLKYHLISGAVLLLLYVSLQGAAAQTKANQTKVSQVKVTRPPRPVAMAALPSKTATSAPKPQLNDQLLNAFDWNLTKAVLQKLPNNSVVSPISVKLMLLMLHVSTSKEKAKQEVEYALNTDPALTEDLLNRTLATIAKHNVIQKEPVDGNNQYINGRFFLNETLESRVDKKKELRPLKSSMEFINFDDKNAAVFKINAWANEDTSAKITSIVSTDDVANNALSMILSLSYFSGKWEKQFLRNETKKEKFYTSDYTEIWVQMMSIQGKFYYCELNDLGAYLIRIPYMEHNLAMYILYPHVPERLPEIVQELSPEILTLYERTKKLRQMTIRLPKFQTEERVDLKPILKELGVNSLFQKMDDHHNPLISQVFQKSKLEVNENGSDKPTPTDANPSSSMDKYPLDISITYPFIYFVIDEAARFIQFAGKIEYPVTNEEVYESETAKEERKKRELYEKYNVFDKGLLEKIYLKNVGKNIVISPASIKAALALVLEGANGQSKTEIIEALKLGIDGTSPTEELYHQLKSLHEPSDNIILNTQNKVFIAEKENLKPKYESQIKNKYKTFTEKVNFAKSLESSTTINKWINNATHGKITSISSQGDFNSNTKLFLANSIYFKGEWETKFNMKLTKPACFKNINGDCRKTLFMNARLTLNFLQIHQLDAQLVEIPFKNPHYSMVLLIPTKADGLKGLLHHIQQEQLLHLLDSTKPLQLMLSVPRMTIDFAGSLKEILQELQIEDIFTENADLSDMLSVNKKGIYVSDVNHVAQLEVNENGAEAAAATGVETTERLGPLQVKANKPFAFFIRDRRQTGFLFEGVFMSPIVIDTESTVTTSPTSAPTLRSTSIRPSTGRTTLKSIFETPATRLRMDIGATPFPESSTSGSNTQRPFIVIAPLVNIFSFWFCKCLRLCNRHDYCDCYH